MHIPSDMLFPFQITNVVPDVSITKMFSVATLVLLLVVAANAGMSVVLCKAGQVKKMQWNLIV